MAIGDIGMERVNSGGRHRGGDEWAGGGRGAHRLLGVAVPRSVCCFLQLRCSPSYAGSPLRLPLTRVTFAAVLGAGRDAPSRRLFPL